MRPRDKCSYKYMLGLFTGERVEGATFWPSDTLESEARQAEADRRIIQSNFEFIFSDLDEGDLIRVGQNRILERGEITRLQKVFTAPMQIDWRTGQVIAIGTQGNPQAVEAQDHAIDAQLVVHVEDTAFLPEEYEGDIYHFGITCPNNPHTGQPFPLATRFTEQAVRNIEATLSLCNGAELNS